MASSPDDTRELRATPYREWYDRDIEMLNFLLDEYGLTRAQVESAMRAAARGLTDPAVGGTAPPPRAD